MKKKTLRRLQKNAKKSKNLKMRRGQKSIILKNATNTEVARNAEKAKNKGYN